MVDSKKILILTASIATAQIASATGFAEGTIEGMPDVLVLNRISTMNLAKAPDSLLYRSAAYYLAKDVSFWQSAETELSQISIDRDSNVSLRPLLLSAPITQTPGWAQCLPEYVRAPSSQKDGVESAQIVLGHYRQKMMSSCGQTPAAESKTNEFVDKAMGLVRVIQADMKKATQFAFLVKLNFDYERESNINAGSLVKVADLDQSTKAEFSRSERTAAGISIPIGWGNNISDRGQLGLCYPTATVEDAAAQGLLQPGDVSKVCFSMSGMTGMSIPHSLMVRDINQFKEGDDLRLAVVFAPGVQTYKTPNFDKTTIVTITARPAYAQVVDVRTKRAIGDRIQFDKPGAFVYLRPSECYQRVTRDRANAQGAASIGCVSDELRAVMAQRGIASILQIKPQELHEMEKQLIAKAWGDK